MKVNELVRQLQAMPQDAEVIVADDITVINTVETVCSDIDSVCRDTWVFEGDDREHSLVIIAAFSEDDEDDLDDVEGPWDEGSVEPWRIEAHARRVWKEYVRTHGLPPGCPARPDKMYAGRGWGGWSGLLDALADDEGPVDADGDVTVS